MQKKDSWDSEFRKKRFYERQRIKKRKKYLEQHNDNIFLKEHKVIPCDNSLFKKTKQIAIMLDLEGTSEKMNEKTAEVFVKQLDFIRKKFKADVGTISISTQARDSIKMQNILNILEHHTTDKIKIGLCFYYGGIYDFDEKMDDLQEFGFNANKVSTFASFYLRDFLIENMWFAIIDDEISEDVYKNYQNKQPMLVVRPSKNECDLVYNSFMNIATKTKDFDGVIECLNIYINSIKNLTPEQVLEKQKNMICHLSSSELYRKVRHKHDYSFLERYFREGYADVADYQDALTWLGFTEIVECSTEELLQIKSILTMIRNKYEKEENSLTLKKVKEVAQLFKVNDL